MAAPLVCGFRSNIKGLSTVLSSTVYLQVPSNYIFQKRWRKGQGRRLIYSPDGVHHVPGIPVHPDKKFPSLEELEETTKVANYPVVKPKFPPGQWGRMDREKAWMYHSLKEHILTIPDVNGRKKVFLNRKRTRKEHWIDEIKNTPPHYCVVLDPINDHPLALPFRNYITKTQIFDWVKNIENDTDTINKSESIKTKDFGQSEEIINYVISNVKQDVSDFLISNEKYVQRQEMPSSLKYSFRAQLLFRCISESVIYHASQYQDFHHLRTCQYDEDVIVRANWHRFGIEKPVIQDPKKKEEKENWNYFKMKYDELGLTPDGLHRPLPEYKSTKEIVDIMTKNDNAVYSEVKFDTMIRSCLPLPQISNELRTESPPTLPYRISSYGCKYKPWQIYEETTAGFTGARNLYQENIPLDPCEYGLVGFLYTGDSLKLETKYNMEIAQASRTAMGITASFTWLAAQAMNQGFNQIVDLTYPLAAQTVMSDGQTFSFLKYQLNTIELWKENEANNLVNLCWATKEQKLYHSVENGQVNELNEDIIQRIVEMFITVPKDRGYDMKPTLTKTEERYVVPDLIIEEEVIEKEQYIV